MLGYAVATRAGPSMKHPKFIRITRDLVVPVHTYDGDTGADGQRQRAFRAGAVYRVQRVLAADASSAVLELRGLGYVEIPNDAWAEGEEVIFPFFPGRLSPN
jgi:hypothetical protein